MEVNIRYFGMIAEKLGKQEDRLELEPMGCNVRQLMDQRHPELRTMTYAVAIDHELRELIEPGEGIREIAILPPFAGG